MAYLLRSSQIRKYDSHMCGDCGCLLAWIEGSTFSPNSLLLWVKKERELEASVRLLQNVYQSICLVSGVPLLPDYRYGEADPVTPHRTIQERGEINRTQYADAVDVRATTSKRAPAALAAIPLPRNAHVGGHELKSPPCHHHQRPLWESFLFTAVQWGQKAIGRKTTGTGRMRYLKDLPRRFKNGFQEGEHLRLGSDGAQISHGCVKKKGKWCFPHARMHWCQCLAVHWCFLSSCRNRGQEASCIIGVLSICFRNSFASFTCFRWRLYDTVSHFCFAWTTLPESSFGKATIHVQEYISYGDLWIVQRMP